MGVKSEASVEVSSTCIIFNDQQGKIADSAKNWQTASLTNTIFDFFGAAHTLPLILTRARNVQKPVPTNQEVYASLATRG